MRRWAVASGSVRRVEEDSIMLIPVVIFLLAAYAGVIVSSRWIPDLATGSAGGLAFFLVCGLVGAAAGLLSTHIYIVVEELKHLPSRASQGEIVAGFLRNLSFELGSLLGFAGVVYLLAPAPEIDAEFEAELVT